jgi:hypothetical protein
MRVRYEGQSFSAGLTNGKEYEVTEVEPVLGFLRIIDDGWEPACFEPNVSDKPGYLYSPTNPGPFENDRSYGHFVILADDEKGSLAKAING